MIAVVAFLAGVGLPIAGAALVLSVRRRRAAAARAPRPGRGPLPEGGDGLATFYAFQLAAGRIERRS